MSAGSSPRARCPRASTRLRSTPTWSRPCARGEDLYHLDEGALADLDADLVVTQDLCAVCAVDVSVVDDALAHLGCTAEVLTVDPHTLEEVLDSVITLGDTTGRRAEAETLVASLQARLDAVREQVAARRQDRPRVLLLEWTDPPFAPGHWVPEMVALAGGYPSLGEAGSKSVRVTWEDVAGQPSGPGRVRPVRLRPRRVGGRGADLVASGRLPEGVPVWAVDANASYARPGPRLVDGIETLARIIAGQEPDPGSARRIG